MDCKDGRSCERFIAGLLCGRDQAVYFNYKIVETRAL